MPKSKTKSQERLPSAAVNGKWESELIDVALSHQADTFKYNPNLFFINSNFSTSNLYQTIKNTETCDRRTFDIISYQSLLDEAVKYGDPKKRPKEFSPSAPLGFGIAEMTNTQIVTNNKNNEKLPTEEQTDLYIPPQAIAALIKFLSLLIKDQRIEKLTPKVDTLTSAKPKSPKGKGKAKGKNEPDPDATPELNKDWSSLKKRGEEEDSGKYLDDEPKLDRAPTHYTLIIDVPQDMLSKVIYHSAVGMKMPVKGVLYTIDSDYDTKLHAEWDKTVDIPSKQLIPNLNFDTVATTCYNLIISELENFENFKKNLRILTPQTATNLNKFDEKSVVGGAINSILTKIIDDEICDKNDKESNDSPSLDQLLQFESDSSYCINNTNNLPELVGKNLENDISKIFDSSCVNEQTAKQQGLYHELMNLYQNKTADDIKYSLEKMKSDTELNCKVDVNISGSFVDLYLKLLVSQDLNVDNIFVNKASGVDCGENFNQQNLNFNCIEHLSKEALRSRLSEIDANYSKITVKKFKGDNSKLIIASNQPNKWNSSLIGNLNNQQFHHFILPKIQNWIKMYDYAFNENENKIKNLTQSHINKSRQNSANSSKSQLSNKQINNSNDTRFVQKDSLKGRDLNMDKSDLSTTEGSISSKDLEPKKRKSSKASLTNVKSKTASRASSRKSNHDKSEEIGAKIEISCDVSMPEFLGTNVEIENRRGECKIFENDRFLKSVNTSFCNQQNTKFITTTVREKLNSNEVRKRMIICNHEIENFSTDLDESTLQSNLVIQLSEGTHFALQNYTVKQVLSKFDTIYKDKNYSKIPKIEDWVKDKIIDLSASMVSETPNLPPSTGKVSKTNNKKKGSKTNVVEVEPEPVEVKEETIQDPFVNLNFGLENGLIGEFVKVDGKLCVRLTWNSEKNIKDDVSNTPHPSTSIKSRLLTSDGIVVDTLNNLAENIVYTPSGGKYSITSTETTNLVDPDVLKYTSHDPATNESFTQRNDGVRLVSRSDGSNITHHTDGTRITIFDNFCRIEHPAYGSCLFVKDSIALTLTTGCKIMVNACGDKYILYDKNDSDSICLTKEGWCLNNGDSLKFDEFEEVKDGECKVKKVSKISFQDYPTNKQVILCQNQNGSGFEFCLNENVDQYIIDNNCGVYNYYGKNVENEGVVTTSTVEKCSNNFSKLNLSLWESNYKYQEDSLIPQGLRISQIGGGSHSVIQKPSVLTEKHLQNVPKIFKIRRFDHFPKLDLDRFIQAILQLESNNLPKTPILQDQNATIEQGDLITTVLGQTTGSSLTHISDNTNQNSDITDQISPILDPNEAEKCYNEAQKPKTPKCEPVVASASEKSMKRLKRYKKQLDKFKVDLSALKDRDVPKYFDSDLGMSWLQTKMVLDSLARECPS